MCSVINSIPMIVQKCIVNQLTVKSILWLLNLKKLSLYSNMSKYDVLCLTFINLS